MEKKKNGNFQNKKKKILRTGNIAVSIVIAQLALCNTVLAAPATLDGEGGTAVQKVMGTVLQWLQYVGGVVAVVGIAQFVLSWQRDDADGKSRAMKVLMAGAMLFGISPMAKYFITVP